jgi:hypothetical protein
MLFFHNGWDSFPPVSGVLPPQQASMGMKMRLTAVLHPSRAYFHKM